MSTKTPVGIPPIVEHGVGTQVSGARMAITPANNPPNINGRVNIITAVVGLSNKTAGVDRERQAQSHTVATFVTVAAVGATVYVIQ